MLAADSMVSGVGFFFFLNFKILPKIGFILRKKLHYRKAGEAMRLGQSVPTDPEPSLPIVALLVH